MRKYEGIGMKRKPWADYVRVATPGPWGPGSLALDRRAGRYIRPITGGASICQVTVYRRNWRENARLIAAAPLMHELLMRAYETKSVTHDLRARIHETLEMIAGRSPFPEPNPWRCKACDLLSQEPKTGCHHKEEPEDG